MLEILIPNITDYVYATNNTYKISELISMELLLLKTLHFSLPPLFPLSLSPSFNHLYHSIFKIYSSSLPFKLSLSDILLVIFYSI